MFAYIKRIDKLGELKIRLKNELKLPDLPKHRKDEAESYLYYVNEQIRYIQGNERDE